MGLDMYLTGDRYRASGVMNRETGRYDPVAPTYVDGFQLKSERLELGYWRKNAPLHTLMVAMFAEGKDDCRPIELTAEQLREVAHCLRTGQLPKDEECHGFFFGNEEWWAECRENAEEDAKIFDAAADWMESCEDRFWNSVEYQASW